LAPPALELHQDEVRDGDDGQEPPRARRARERTLVTLERGAENIDVDVRLLVVHLGADGRPTATEPRSAQRIHGAAQVADGHEDVYVLREPLVAMLDHGEAADDGERDPRV